MNVFQSFISLGGYNLLSIGLGLLSWGLPIVYLCIKNRREAFTCGSLLCVVLSLYFQLCEVMRRADLHDFGAIEDTINGVCFCATGLVLAALILNTAAWMKKR